MERFASRKRGCGTVVIAERDIAAGRMPAQISLQRAQCGVGAAATPATMAEVRLDVGNAERFSATAQQIAYFDRSKLSISTACCAASKRFGVAQDPRSSDPGPVTAWDPGNLG
jgi:hypothetical protein